MARIFTVNLRNGDDRECHVNEEHEPQALQDPVLQQHLIDEFGEEHLKEGMNEEMSRIKEFDVKDDIHVNDLPPSAWQEAMDLIWVLKWKGSSVRARLCVRGFNQWIKDLDETFASTPVIVVLKLLILFAISFNWCIESFDITTAFLHAVLDPSEEIFVRPPPEYYPSGTVLWKLKRAMYGLRTAPRSWQDHFAWVLNLLGFIRLKSDSNIYLHPLLCLILLAYVDDLLIFGLKENIFRVVEQIKEHLLVKHTGSLNADGDRIRFLGRWLQRVDVQYLYMKKQATS